MGTIQLKGGCSGGKWTLGSSVAPWAQKPSNSKLGKFPASRNALVREKLCHHLLPSNSLSLSYRTWLSDD